MAQNIVTPRSALATRVASSANAAASITLAAVAGQAHHITSLDVTVSATVTNVAITITDGSTVIQEWRITGTGGFTKQFPLPIRCTTGAAVVVDIGAGGGAVVTVTSLCYFTQ